MAILKALHTHGVDYIVGGGVACVLHGVERVTMDVEGTPIRLIGRRRLLEIKQNINPRRTKDLLDIETLSRLEESEHE